MAERRAAGEALIANGSMSREQVDAWLNPPAPAAPGQPGTASAAHLAEMPSFLAALSEADARSWIQSDIRAGLLSWQQGADLMAKRGQAADGPTAAVEGAADGDVSPSAKPEGFQDTWSAGKPEEFKLPILTAADGGELQAGEFIATAKTIQHVLAAGEFPADVGSYLAKEAAATQATFAKMAKSETAEVDKKLWVAKQRFQLEQRYGADLDAKLGLANRFLDELGLKHPPLVEWLHDNGVTSNAAAIGQLIEHATRLAQKRGVDVSQFAGKKPAA